MQYGLGDNYVLRGGQTYTFTSTLTSPSGSSSCSSFVSVAQVAPEVFCKPTISLQASADCQAKLSQGDLVNQILDYSLPGTCNSLNLGKLVSCAL